MVPFDPLITVVVTVTLLDSSDCFKRVDLDTEEWMGLRWETSPLKPPIPDDILSIRDDLEMLNGLKDLMKA